jgi:epoxyqueuosine reductase
VALGNALRCSDGLREAVQALQEHPSPLVREHLRWALEQGQTLGPGESR